MALIKCKKCGYYVAENVHTCPHCGAELHPEQPETQPSAEQKPLHRSSSSILRSQSRSVRLAIASFLLVLLLVLGYVFLLYDDEQQAEAGQPVPAATESSTEGISHP